MALQRGQGCLPSKVFVTASWNEFDVKIVREHRRPRDGLQQRPMRAEHRHEREDEKNFAEPLEHETN